MLLHVISAALFIVSLRFELGAGLWGVSIGQRIGEAYDAWLEPRLEGNRLGQLNAVLAAGKHGKLLEHPCSGTKPSDEAGARVVAKEASAVDDGDVLEPVSAALSRRQLRAERRRLQRQVDRRERLAAGSTVPAPAMLERDTTANADFIVTGSAGSTQTAAPRWPAKQRAKQPTAKPSPTSDAADDNRRIGNVPFDVPDWARRSHKRDHGKDTTET